MALNDYPKPVSGAYTINSGAAKYPVHLFMFDENTSTAVNDQGSAGTGDLTLASDTQWTTDPDTIHGTVITTSTTGPMYALSGTITPVFSTSALMLVIARSASTTNPTSNNYLATFGHTTTGSIYAGPRFVQNNNGEVSAYTDDLTAAVITDHASATDFYDSAWHVFAFKTSDGSHAISVDGGAWTEATGQAFAPAGIYNRFGFGVRTTPTLGESYNGTIAAGAIWTNDYSGWTDTWISDLYNGGDIWTAMGVTSSSAPTGRLLLMGVG